MLGTLRFLLALSVVKAHIWPTGQSWLAWESVFAFYTLSGYLMTLVLNEVYGFSFQGIKAFIINRILRLAPAYYLSIILASLAIIFLFPLNNLNGDLRLPTHLYDIFSNLFLLGQISFDNSFLVTSRLSPSSWSLSIELFCYILFALGFAKSPKRLLSLLLIGIVMSIGSHLVATHQLINAEWHYDKFAFQNHYGVLHAGFIPFALGGLGYFFRDEICTYFNNKIFILFSILGILITFSWHWESVQFVWGLFLASLLTSVSVPMMMKHSVSGLFKRIDKWLGDLSYPVFITHWVIASIIAASFIPLSKKSLGLLIATLVGTLAFSVPIVLLERKINSTLRKRVRAIAKKQTKIANHPGEVVTNTI